MALEVGAQVQVKLNKRIDGEIVAQDPVSATVVGHMPAAKKSNNSAGESLTQVELEDGTKVAVRDSQIVGNGDAGEPAGESDGQ